MLVSGRSAAPRQYGVSLGKAMVISLTCAGRERIRLSAHQNRVLPAGHELSDDRRARDLAGDQQPARGLCVGEQEGHPARGDDRPVPQFPRFAAAARGVRAAAARVVAGSGRR